MRSYISGPKAIKLSIPLTFLAQLQMYFLQRNLHHHHHHHVRSCRSSLPTMLSIFQYVLQRSSQSSFLQMACYCSLEVDESWLPWAGLLQMGSCPCPVLLTTSRSLLHHYYNNFWLQHFSVLHKSISFLFRISKYFAYDKNSFFEKP